MGKEANPDRVPLSLYLYLDNTPEGELAALLKGTRRRQALMREYVLLGYQAAKLGMRLDANQQVVRPGTGADFVPVPPAAGTQGVAPQGDPAEGVAEEAALPLLRSKYGGLT